MAVKIVCDSCEKAVDEKDVCVRGVALERQYCPACVEQIDEMLGEVDGLHDSLAARWREDLEEIHSKYSKICGRLPDVKFKET